ncbi:unnamed protein product [Cylicocyclus nassatus]|uniref:Uncharacterized protein n=1 Tax=Cylicocyclus nassatus TaxID=53992 RepID=A0AA36DNN9_CYLNA|nr:unnamed protein product [Cylicocyclus nassatus]
MCHNPGCGYRGIRYFRDSIVLPAIQTRRDHPLITRGIILACYFFTQFFHRSHRFMQFAVPAISYTVPCIDPSSRLHVEGDINSGETRYPHHCYGTLFGDIWYCLESMILARCFDPLQSSPSIYEEYL